MQITVNINAPELSGAILALAAALTPSKESTLQLASAPETVQPVYQPVQQQPQGTGYPPPEQYQTHLTSQQHQAYQQFPGPSSSAVPVSAPAAYQPTYAPPVQQHPPQQPQGVPVTPQSYSIDQLSVAATQLVDAGRRADLVGLLNSFGVDNLMALPKEHYGNFATQLRAMGAKL